MFHVLLQGVVNVQPESTAGVGCTATPRLWMHRALNIAMFSDTENGATICMYNVSQDKLNTNSKIPRAQPQLQLN